jgi:pyruvate dehydrogenase E2 component (dihydrolipoamide acetyltransferase)
MIVIMPQIGMTMQEGTITRWLKEDGERVEKGEPLYELVTEKLENEIEAPCSGTLKILKPADLDDSVPCGDPIAEIIED